MSSNPLEKKREKNPHAVALGQLGGFKGGKARAEKLRREAPHRLKEIAQKAGRARWDKNV